MVVYTCRADSTEDVRELPRPSALDSSKGTDSKCLF